MFRRIGTVALLIFLFLLAVAAGGKGGKPSTCLLCFGATATFRDGLNDKILSDGDSYVGTGTSGLNDLEGAFISVNGGLWLTLLPPGRRESPTGQRYLELIFDDPDYLTGVGCTPPDSVQLIGGDLRINGNDDVDENLLQPLTDMANGTSLTGFGVLRFTDPVDGSSWELRFPRSSLNISREDTTVPHWVIESQENVSYPLSCLVTALRH